MIQDQSIQGLWEAVEELRRRVEGLENGHQFPDPRFNYIASSRSNRKTFHLRDCRFAGAFLGLAGGFREFESRSEAISSGLIPCKSCGA